MPIKPITLHVNEKCNVTEKYKGYMNAYKRTT